MRILLIAGGWSTEREVSLSGARVMAKAMERLGHTVTIFDLQRFDELSAQAEQHDVAIINLHGQPGEDGLCQAMLERIGCPYQGTGPSGSLLALNKAAAKQIVSRFGIPTPSWEFLPVPPDAGWQPRLPYPLFVKSDTGGSSIHLARVETNAELSSIMKDIFAAGTGVLIEEAVSGQEVTCGILGNEPLPPVLIEPLNGSYFDFSSKYAKDGARELCPAPLPASVLDEVQRLSLEVHRVLGLEGVSRSDFILDASGKLHWLEVNTLPGMTETSLVPREAMACGLDFPALMQRFIDLALEKGQRHGS
ncbi:MAG: D-alanine--D-alanine ligase [Desulfovibrio sp.]|nr:D-alanine--D-alanine ligase [Desulfovibrio sp.]